MKRERNRLRNTLFALTVIVLSFGGSCRAEGTAVIMETKTNETDVSIYVKNAEGAMSDLTVQIGTSDNAAVTQMGIEDSEFETLILIDNSLSIPKSDRSRISELLYDFVGKKAGNEKVAIGVFSRNITYLTDYTANRQTLENAIEAIEYQNQETYITDMLYELLSKEYASEGKDIYGRIVLIADGIDNESLGYTTEELNQLIKKDRHPIYTIGCQTKENNQELERLFALSRLTNAEYFLLEDTEETGMIADTLSRDKQIVKVTVAPSAELMDGSIKTVKLLFSGQSLTEEVRMPQQIQAVKEPEEEQEKLSETVVEIEEKTEEVSEEMSTSQEDEEALHKRAVQKFMLCMAVFWIVVILIILVAVLVRHYKKKQQSELSGKKNLMTQRELELKKALAEGQQIKQIVLTDVHSPSRSFRVPAQQSIIIGRSQNVCQVVIDDNKTVSGRHCELYMKNGRVMIRDLHSSNGTFVNGNRIYTDTELMPGSIITLGNLEMRFEQYG